MFYQILAVDTAILITETIFFILLFFFLLNYNTFGSFSTLFLYCT